MRPLAHRAFLLLALACPASAVRVEVALPGEARPGAIGATAGALSAAPAPVTLSVPSLSASALSAAAPVPVASPAALPILAAPMAAPVAAPAPLVPSAIPARPSLEQPRAAEAAQPGAESETEAGRRLFDAAAPAREDGGLWSKVKAWLPVGDIVASWPGRAGQKVRLGGRTLTLEAPIGDGGGSRVWKTREGDWVVKILHPQFLTLPHYVDEAAILRSIKDTDIPHAKLEGASPDGAMLVKEFITGRGARELLAEGFTDLQKEGWPELAAKLVRAGVTADLAPANLVWQHWQTRWTIVDAGGIAPGRPGLVLDQLMTRAAAEAGVEPAEFLSGLRGRLGPESADWGKALAHLRSQPRHAPALAALARADAERPAAPKVAFGPAAAPARFTGRKGTAAEAAQGLGYDPLAARPRRLLHQDDPGKLNTKITAVEPAGKTPVVVKIAERRIIRNELAIRRVVRRYFGRHFEVPAAAGVERGHESYLVMELKAGRPSYVGDSLSGEQRAALAVLAHAFGLSDMNPGNILYPASGLPVLLDFEQAFGRSRPVAGRLPDEGIALEMPWVSRRSLNRVEDYQPAIREWRRLFAAPETRASLREDFLASGFSAEEAAGLLSTVEKNTEDLDWAVQNDVDFVNRFVKRGSRR